MRFAFVSILGLLIPLGIFAGVLFMIFGRKESASASVSDDTPVKPMRTNPRDFADWLSPILVKELRQGMRARVFVSSFLILQGLMIFNVIVGLLSSAQNADTSFSEGFFWWMIGVPVLFVMPLAGLGTISREVTANTLELIFLTRLSAWRIVAGKWLALIAQITLLVTATLPYAVLRYFLGGVNITQDLQIIGWMLFGACVLTAVCVGLSPYQSRLTRVFLVIGVIFGLQGLGYVFAALTFGGVVRGGPGIFDWKSAAAIFAMGTTFLFLMLEIGASKIAPPAENHAARKRLLCVPLFLIALGFSTTASGGEAIAILALVACMIICIDAVCEEPRMIPSIYRPFVKRGVFGRFGGRFLYPGWPAGAACTLVLFAAFGALFWKQKMLDEQKAVILFVSAWGAIVMPIAVIRCFFPRVKKVFATYFGIQIGLIVFSVLAALADNMIQLKIRAALFLFPTCTMMLTLMDTSKDCEDLFLVGASVVTALSFVVLFVRMSRPAREIRAMEKQAHEQPSDAHPVAAV